MNLREERENHGNKYTAKRWVDYYEHLERVRLLCEHLPGWEAMEAAKDRDDYPPYEIRVDGPGEYGLFIRADNGRYRITGHYPRHTNGQYAGYRIATPTITVSASRPLDKIARDIQRRFIPDYGKAVEACRAEIKELDEFNNVRDATLQSLAGILGNQPSKHTESTISLYRGGISVKARVHSGQSVEIEVGSVSRARAEKLCRLIMDECF